MKNNYTVVLSVTLLLIATIAGCASPNVWVQARSQNAGIIGYQNYNPRSDNGKRIEDLIHCRDGHRMVLNTQRSQATGAVSYMKMDDMVLPMDNGVVSWVEYHYECMDSVSSTPAPMKKSEPDYGEMKVSCNVGFIKSCQTLISYYYKKNDDASVAKTLEHACKLKDPVESSWMCLFLASNMISKKADYEGAIPILRIACSLKSPDPKNRDSLRACGFLGAYTKDKKQFNEVEMTLKDMCEMGSTHRDCYDLACMYSRLGDQKNSLLFLRKSEEKGFSDIAHIMKDPDLKLLRSTPQFLEFMEGFGERTPASKK